MKVNIERLNKNECEDGGRLLTINYSFADTLFGDVLVASTRKGICFMEFVSSHDDALSKLKRNFPNASYIFRRDELQAKALTIFSDKKVPDVLLNIKGTEFQLKVWNALLETAIGTTVSYADIARSIDNAKACRAVGSAVGRNPVAVIIPCHRVIQSSGALGGYKWGEDRKRKLILWESELATHQR